MTLSIITINYNNRAGLQRTIDSVICQTWKDYEWIVIDGGSKDGSKELIEQYQQHFAYWCSEPDKGVYNAMNKGVVHAHGDYLIFMNSGDAFYDGSVLEEIYSLNSSADIITGQIVSLDKLQQLHQFCGSLFMQLYETTLPHQGTFIRRDLLIKYPYDEKLKIVSDWKFWLQAIVWGGAKVERTDIIVAKFDTTGISSCKDSTSLSRYVDEREKVKKEFFPPMLRDELEEYSCIRISPFVIYGEYLRNHCHLAFAIGWRLLRFFVYFHKAIFRT